MLYRLLATLALHIVELLMIRCKVFEVPLLKNAALVNVRMNYDTTFWYFSSNVL